MFGRSRWIIAAALLLSGCGSQSQASQARCAVDRGQLPSWATTGFSDPHPRIPHVVGDSGRITAILFGDLVSPPAKDRSNKILWVSKDPQQPMSDLKIRAQRGDEVVERVVSGGPGPSIVDLPSGCWQLTLSWSARTDTLDLQYR